MSLERGLSHAMEHKKWVGLCLLVGLGMLGTIACLSTFLFRTQPVLPDVEDVEIVTCRDLDGHQPISITDIFTENDRICVSIKAKLKNVEELRRMLPPETQLPSLRVIEYYEGQKIGGEYLVNSSYLPDGWITGAYCTEAVRGSLPVGRYKVEVRILSTAIGTAEYQVR